MISLLVPSRRRPKEFWRMYESAYRTSYDQFEALLLLDEDDPTIPDYQEDPRVRIITTPRQLMAENWNTLAKQATGDILWHGGDDMLFRTMGWDQIVEDAFPPDKIALVHGHDLSPNGDWLATAGFIHRKWYEALGFVTAPYFSSDYCDVWLVDLAQALERRIYVPVVIEHLHPAHGKAEWDITHQERLARHAEDEVDDLYLSPEMVAKREQDVAKLRELMS